MKWTDKVPIESGLYWFRNGTDGTPMVVEFRPAEDVGDKIIKAHFAHVHRRSSIYVYGHTPSDQWSDEPIPLPDDPAIPQQEFEERELPEFKPEPFIYGSK